MSWNSTVKGISLLVDALLRGVEYRILLNSFSVVSNADLGENADRFILTDLGPLLFVVKLGWVKGWSGLKKVEVGWNMLK